MDARIVAGGGGDAAASYAGHAVFTSWLGRDPRVLYLPVAMGWDEMVLQRADAWFRSTFEPLGVSSITTCFTSATLDALDLDRYDGVYIGGGNTYLLLALLRESACEARLRRAVITGRPLYGGSAGAVCLGATIASAAHLDENTVELSDERGLDLLAGHALWPHFQEDQRGKVVAFARTAGVPAFAVPEPGAVIWEAGSARRVGSSVYRVQEDGLVAALPVYSPETRPAPAEGGSRS